ncbi:MAG: hypothetical protein Q9208_008203 [Pyrenodesmia sp. 3 TL-2023]
MSVVVPDIEEITVNGGADYGRAVLTQILSSDYKASTPRATIESKQWYGRCVWESDNDVLDDQIVSLTWDDDSRSVSGKEFPDRGPKTAVFHMVAFTEAQCERRGKISGTHGEIQYDSKELFVQVGEPDSPFSSRTKMPQNQYIERWTKQHGKRLDHDERVRKRIARSSHKVSESARSFTGLRAKLYAKKRHAEKIQMKKQIKAHEERNVKSSSQPAEPSSTPLPQYLLDRNQTSNNAKALSSQIKNKRAEKAAKFSVPLPKVKGISEEEMFKVVKTGKKTAKKGWKRMITKPTFVGPSFTRRPVKYERFIRPMGLRYKKAHVTHPELNVTVQLPILSVKKNPQNPLYTQLGVLTKGTIIEVNVSELGIVTAGGKVVWGRWAQVTNNCEMDGCVNAVLLV